ncbi:hypothetical protein MF672_011180 [Actinomadura sp. ATCC 31491]|uniref:MarR family transcriptional regulator n=1 Tax=Actinomadura luzonensis TaxID=2805427 RepID=A0ABT0FPZ0_9ACTN|nr:hypothetical protein [Actinomadura luzonensis]MCK2214349.1 hypothetical protein [Actinomadura luzonensis]
MPKYQALSEYAAAIAPVINAAHVNVLAAAHRAATELAETSGVTPGLLSDLRFALPLRPLPRSGLAAIRRYHDEAARAADVLAHLREGTLTDDGDGLLRLTDRGLAYVHRLYDVHAAAAARAWAAHDPAPLAGLAARVLAHAERVPGGALELVAPPYEPAGTPPGVLLLNRLAALRYHRADAHAAAWRAAGLSAAEIVGLRDGPLRAGVELETNERAGAPYGALSAGERETLYDGLLKLV